MSILSIDAKDLYNANHQVMPAPEGYCIRDENGNLNLRRFTNSFDYSLELIKLRDIYYRVYTNNRFSFHTNNKEYTQHIINVTFKYSQKEWNKTVNRFGHGYTSTFWVRAGYDYHTLVFHEHLAFDEDELVGIETGVKIDNPVAPDILGDVFYFDEKAHMYAVRENANKTLMSRKDLRTNLYENGFVCDGIRYVRFKRSSGSSRVGKCLFINEDLYHRMHIWEKCGIPLREGKGIDLAAWEAYISLTASSIIDTIEIKPENILLIDDYDSTFTDKMLAISVNNEKDIPHLESTPCELEISNSIWDGQSLMDVSMFEKYPDKAMLLLRNRFFKSACFNANIQQFFADNGITDVSQLNGITRATRIEDIKLITTPNSLKYLKFGEFNTWLDRLEPAFGIVKFDKPSYYFGGKMVQAHYQLLNTLHMSKEDVIEFLEPSRKYLEQLEQNPAVLRWHIGVHEMNEQFTPCECLNDIVFHFLGVNDEFAQTKMYRSFVQKLIKAYKDNIRRGHVLVRGTYATLLSCPYEMLQASIGAFTGESNLGVGNSYCSMFEDGVELLGSRSPHVAAGNILLTRNTRNESLDRYLNLSPYVVCINTINENILERLSGADMDSDTMLLTSDPLLVRKAHQHYNDFLVPTQLVNSQNIKRPFTNVAKAELDYKTSDNRIGEIVNLSQELNSLLWDKVNKGASFEDVSDIYNDIAQLDVLSTLEIDSAKREFPVNSGQEMKRIRSKYNLTDKTGRKIKPYFFAHISRRKGYYNTKRNHYKHHLTTMDHVQEVVSKWRCKMQSSNELKSFSSVFSFKYYHENAVQHGVFTDLLELLRDTNRLLQSLWLSYKQETETSARESIWEHINDVMQNRINYVTRRRIGTSTLYWILLELEKPEYRDVQSTFLKILFGHPTQNFRQFLKGCGKPIRLLEPDDDGEIDLYGFRFKEVEASSNEDV